MTGAYQQYLGQVEQCPPSVDGNLNLKLDSTIKKGAVNGYLELKRPDLIRYTVFTPLGQPIFALVCTSETFQYIEAGKRVFNYGSLRSYALRANIPPGFLNRAWYNLLIGIPQPNSQAVLDVRQDKTSSSIWFSLAQSPEAAVPTEYVMLDDQLNLLLKRIIVDESGTMLATLTYAEHTRIGACMVPMRFTVEGLSFGAAIEAQLSDLQLNELQDDRFSLPIPPGYVRRFFP